MIYLYRMLFSAILIACCGSAWATLRVVTTTEDLAALARAVGGDGVEVVSLTPGSRDPHFAAARPSMIRRVHDADLLLVIGAGLEQAWLPKLLSSARNPRVQPGQPGYLDLSASVNLLEVASGPVSRAMGDVHPDGNPHYWLDPRNGIRMAQAIAQRLAELDPTRAAAYRQAAADLRRELESKYEHWRRRLASVAGQPVVSYHNSFVYLAQAFGFNIIAQVEPKPGIAPSAASLNALLQRICADQVKLLIMEPYYERRSAAYLEAHGGVRTVVLPQSVGGQAGIASYVDLFEAIVQALSPDGGA